MYNILGRLGGFSIKIKVDIIDQGEEELVLKVKSLDDDLLRLINSLQAKNAFLWVNKDEQLHKIKLKDVYYFEAVEKKVFLYTKDEVFEIKEKLYQLEEKYKDTQYIRVSKSVILNIEKIELISPTFNGRLIVKLKNDEKISISRNYVRNLKNQLGMEE
ncbi:hypothetical protein IGI67_001903 [Enterococcus sp. AZ196]